jgi:TonB-dependent receptor
VPVIKVAPNEITVLTVSMMDSVKALSGILITARRAKADNTSGLAIERKSSPLIVDGLAQDVIRRTPDRTTAEAMKRIAGVTVQDNKFAVVRGLSDRYNLGFINGAPLPSALPDRKAFALDVIPSSLIDNIMIIKSASADLPGEFAGAIIRINTRDIPDESIQTLSIGLAGYTNTVGQSMLWQDGSWKDKAGFGNESRALPGGMPNSQDYMQSLTKAERADFSKRFANNWGLQSATGMPGLQLQYSNSSRFLLAGKEAGSLLALSYSSLPRFNAIERNEFSGTNKTQQYTENQYTRNVLWGAIANVSMKLNKYNKLTFRNLFSNNTDEQNNVREGVNNNLSTWQQSYSMNYLQNYFFSTQLAGDHFFKERGIKFQWNGSLQFVDRNTPDYRRLMYTRPDSNSNAPLIAAIGQTGSLENAGKLFSSLTENVSFASYSITKSWFSDNFKSDWQVGGFHLNKRRTFDARVLAMVENGFSAPDSLKRLNASQIFSADNIGGNGFRIDELVNPSNYYTGTQSLHAGYIMSDNIIDRTFRINAGVRVEKFNQSLETARPNGQKINPTFKDFNILPSIAFTIIASSRSNIRMAYASTVFRPDFREISPFTFFDFVNFVSITGNDSLKSGTVQNFDVRFETYPGDGQSFSVGAFVKNFKNPIEQIVSPVLLNGNRSIGYLNAKEASVYGVEAEFRFKLRKLNHSLKNFQAYGNATIIGSQVKLDSLTRPMQGQAPYSINTGLLYSSRKTGYSISLNYNLVGPRISAVGNSTYPDFYEKQRHVFDIQLAKTFGKRTEFKLNVGDLFAQDLVIYQNNDANKNFSKSDNVVNRYKMAPLIITTLTYRLN